MSYWNTLGIECTKDLSLIKKAYAKALRIHHPEKDPDGFQRLRSAYEYAQNYAKTTYNPFDDYDDFEDSGDFSDISNENEMEKEIVIQTTPIVEPLFTPDLDPYQDRKIETPYTPPLETNTEDPVYLHQKSITSVDAFMDAVECLYGDFYRRVLPENWIVLTEEDIFWRLDLQRQLSQRLLTFFLSHYVIPTSIFMIFHSHFHWDSSHYNNTMDQENQNKIKRMLDNPFPGLFQDLFDYKDLNLTDYYAMLFDAHKLLTLKEFYKALRILEKASQEYPETIDFMILKGITLLQMNRLNESAQVFSALRLLHSTEFQLMQLIGNQYLANRYFSRALEYYILLYKHHHQDSQLLEPLLTCLTSIPSSGFKNKKIIETASLHPNSRHSKMVLDQLLAINHKKSQNAPLSLMYYKEYLTIKSCLESTNVAPLPYYMYVLQIVHQRFRKIIKSIIEKSVRIITLKQRKLNIETLLLIVVIFVLLSTGIGNTLLDTTVVKPITDDNFATIATALKNHKSAIQMDLSEAVFQDHLLKVLIQDPYVLGEYWKTEVLQEGIYGFRYATKVSRDQYFVKKIKKDVTHISQSLVTENQSQIEYINAVYDYMIKKYQPLSHLMSYQESDTLYLMNPYTSSPLKLLEYNMGDSLAYAQMFKLLLAENGVNAVVVSGKVLDETHFWNKVYIDSGWYNIDVALNDFYGQNITLYSDDLQANSHVQDEKWELDLLLTKYGQESESPHEFYTKNSDFAYSIEDANDLLANGFKSFRLGSSIKVSSGRSCDCNITINGQIPNHVHIDGVFVLLTK